MIVSHIVNLLRKGAKWEVKNLFSIFVFFYIHQKNDVEHHY